ncbi:spermatogenesis-associated serine-rich protein 2-like [Clavelina lepadiformis]|uniref:Spermatogenesis-associated serine-rich protein 2 n=1 Tax=Clavelina lepadiformis TaxID=159417 RepID=A0ABP0F6I0_CLALP
MGMESVKEKIAAVRAFVSNYSNDEIVLVLQNHDYNIDKTISAFVQGEAADILTEWKHAGTTKSSKAKKKKKRAQKKRQKQTETLEKPADDFLKSSATVEDGSLQKTSKLSTELNSQITLDDSNCNSTVTSSQAAILLKHMLTNPLESHTNIGLIGSSVEHTTMNPEEKTKTPLQANLSVSIDKHLDEEKLNSDKLYMSGHRSETSERVVKMKTRNIKQKTKDQLSAASRKNLTSPQSMKQVECSQQNTTLVNKKSIEKASKDLQRCVVSFGRYKTLLNEEINDSYRRIKKTFEELLGVLNDREVTLICRLDEMKEEAFALFAKREARASELKKQTDRVETMSKQEVAELRNNIKHFVAERKYDEELGRTTRFTFDKNVITNVIPKFGQICAVKNSYSAGPRERVKSISVDMPCNLKPDMPKDQTSDFTAGDTLDSTDTPEPSASIQQQVSPFVREEGDIVSREVITPVHNPLHPTDWADHTDHHPLPEIPASWNEDSFSDIKAKDKMHLPDKLDTSREKAQSLCDGQYEKDKNIMPSPLRIPSVRSNRSQRRHTTPRPDSTDQKGEHQKQFYKTHQRSFVRECSENGYRNNSRGRRGYRGAPTGAFRNGPNGRYRDNKTFPSRDFIQPSYVFDDYDSSRPQRNRRKNDLQNRFYQDLNRQKSNSSTIIDDKCVGNRHQLAAQDGNPKINNFLKGESNGLAKNENPQD